MDDVPLEQVREFVQGFADEMDAVHSDVMTDIQTTGTISDAAAQTIRTELESYKHRVLSPAQEKGR